MILMMYSDYTNYVDPQNMITIFLSLVCILHCSLQTNSYFLCSNLAIDIFLFLLAPFPGLLRA
jgi:hypothetical protein